MRRRAPPSEAPLALIAKRNNTLRLEAVDEAAAALGLTPGLPLAAARARVPDLAVAQADPAADAALLAAVGEVCRQFTPAFALAPPDGVNLDITGLERLFGGDAALAEALAGRMARLQIVARIGVGRTLGLAWALARHGAGPQGKPRVRAHRDLPVGALGLDAESLGLARRLGLRTIGQILDMPRAALARRLGEPLLHRLDELLGLRAPALDFAPAPVTYFVQRRLAEPIVSEEQVSHLALRLATGLARTLEARGVGGRRFVLDLFRMDGVVKRLSAPCGQPLRDPVRIRDLFIERLATLNDGLEADFGFDLLRLTAETTEPLRPEAPSLLKASSESDPAPLLDRLGIRLGPGAVFGLAPAADSRVPERAERRIAPLSHVEAWADEPPAAYQGALLRPLALFSPPQPISVIAGVPEDPPQQFNWRRRRHKIVRAEGPERIAYEWWR